MKASVAIAVLAISLLVVFVAAKPHRQNNQWGSGLEQGKPQQRPQQRPGSESSEEQWPVGPGSGSDEDSNGKCGCIGLLGTCSLNCCFILRTTG